MACDIVMARWQAIERPDGAMMHPDGPVEISSGPFSHQNFDPAHCAMADPFCHAT